MVSHSLSMLPAAEGWRMLPSAACCCSLLNVQGCWSCYYSGWWSLLLLLRVVEQAVTTQSGSSLLTLSTPVLICFTRPLRKGACIGVRRASLMANLEVVVLQSLEPPSQLPL